MPFSKVLILFNSKLLYISKINVYINTGSYLSQLMKCSQKIKMAYLYSLYCVPFIVNLPEQMCGKLALWENDIVKLKVPTLIEAYFDRK